MSLPHAILGFLQMHPMTGYDLKTLCFDGSVAHFWPADQAQIYRTLEKLAEQELIKSELEVQEDRPNRKVYSITEAGRAEFARWLLIEQPLPIHREPFLVQLFFAGQLPRQQLLSLMQAQFRAHEALLLHYQQIEIPEDPAQESAFMFQQMTLDMGIRLEQTYMDWLRDCMAALQKSPA